jgi:hypothetical protein
MIMSGARQIMNSTRSKNYRPDIDIMETAMDWIQRIWMRIRMEIRYRRKLREMRKRDPFIYK